MDRYVLHADELARLEGIRKTHFLNSEARRVNKSLGDLTGLTTLGVHLIEVPPGCLSSEFHLHHMEDEAVYILEGEAQARIGEETVHVSAGDFIGYRAGGLGHNLRNCGEGVLRCLVMGARLGSDVCDYPDKQQRLFRHSALPWNLVNMADIDEPVAGRKI
ncbi:cupin domain-containing protein [Aeromonas simiae]|uniref:Cupin domain-containing protein n=1 Tax=Aeromonas simiae TaxID=218936 RepID=A0A5J6WYC7_9GAMM|nr:cupin domain-containing protein [Aeromonas simiae]MDO2948877.1 cupin domain-containing protein [Aeromonas simiae]MDO2956260.1 cupin domain-containing protein [Aeromonas simiae]QFI54848.1 cupin domain-containing protein [Aeromonas simiae]